MIQSLFAIKSHNRSRGFLQKGSFWIHDVPNPLTNNSLSRSVRMTVPAFVMMLFSVLLGSPGTRAQSTTVTSDSAKPTVPFQTFDVIAIRPVKAGIGNMDLHSDEATLRATNVSVKMLLMNAYGVRPNMMSGLPKWAEDTRYDIDAKVSDPNPAFKNRVLPRSEGEAVWHAELQALLSNGFHLEAHYETVTGTIYNLVVVSGGPLFATSKVPADQEGMNANNTTLTGLHIPIKTLCAGLESIVGRNVTDKTGLNGSYDIKLSWTPDDLSTSAEDSGITNRSPDIYVALQEQLGLKLVPTKGPIRRLVIDSIEPPTMD